MKRKFIAIVFACAVLAACGITLAQNPITPLPAPGYSPGYATPQIPTTSTPVKTNAKPEDLSIDQILDAVESIREQKEELEKKEKLFLKALNRKTEKLKERIERVNPEATTPTPVPVSPAVSQNLYVPTTSTGVSPTLGNGPLIAVPMQ